MKANARAMTLKEVAARLKCCPKALILFHTRPDADAVGSAFALRLALEALGGAAYCVCADEIPQRLRFLTDGLQESVLPASVLQTFSDALVLSVDTASEAQLGGLAPLFANRISLMIDHHSGGEPYTDHLVCPKAAACAEVILALIEELGVSLTPQIATLLYAAISSDTGSFRYSNTVESTYLAAARLVRTGIDTAEINRRLFECKLPQQVRAEAEGGKRLQFFSEGRVAVVTMPLSVQRELELADEHLGTLIDVARSVAGVEIGASIRENEPGGVFRLSLRANVDIDVSAVAKYFGGGGHVRAAGATLTAASVEDATAMLLAALKAGEVL